jgi:hypothetical protein
MLGARERGGTPSHRSDGCNVVSSAMHVFGGEAGPLRRVDAEPANVQREMTAVARARGSGSRALVALVGLGTAAVAGAAIALAVSSDPGARGRGSARQHQRSRPRSVPVLADLEASGSGLFV